MLQEYEKVIIAQSIKNFLHFYVTRILEGDRCSVVKVIVRLLHNTLMWDLWWAKWHWGRFPPSTSGSSTNSHSNKCLIFIYHPGLVQ
jgi:hypothetical protein